MVRRSLLLTLIVLTGTISSSALIVGVTCPDAYGKLRETAQGRWLELCAERVCTRAEAVEPGTHPWAGDYQAVGWWRQELYLSPDGGFALFHGSMCGNCSGWTGHGRLRWLSDYEFRLEPGFGAEPDALYDQSGILLVPWGELQFVVPESGIEEFCDQARQRQLPGFKVRPAPGLSVPDIPPGLPKVPARFAHLLR